MYLYNSNSIMGFMRKNKDRAMEGEAGVYTYNRKMNNE